MNEEPQPMWPAPSYGSCYPGDHPLSFMITINSVDLYNSAIPHRYVTKWGKAVREWSQHEVAMIHPSALTRRFRAVQKHLRILEALMR